MDKPRLLADKQEHRRRFGMIEQAHIKPLTKDAENLEKSGYGAVPYFDPMGGGIRAQLFYGHSRSLGV